MVGEIIREDMYSRGGTIMAIKLLVGGSPCTYWSIAQTNGRETKAEGMGWELFKNYLIAKEKFKPDFFLYENNKSASQAIKDQIAHEFGVGVDPNVRFTYINSALVSAQNRQRFYVTNFGEIEQPEDRGILLKDILETGNTDRDKVHAVISSAGRTTTREYFDKQQGTMACEPVETDEMIPPCGQRNQEKSRTLTSGYANKSQRDLRKDIETDGFMGAQGVIEPIKVGSLPRPNGELSKSQSGQIYSTEGKSPTQMAGGGGAGAKTGLYAIPVEFDSLSEEYYHGGHDSSLIGMVETPMTYRNGKQPSQQCRVYSCEGKSICLDRDPRKRVMTPMASYATPCEWDENGIPIKAVSCADGKTYTVYKVENGLINIKEKEYPIKLKDGYYIIRKLTVRECARLQTMPDDYCKAVSDSQAYKALGNGWTAEVIIHLLNHALKDVPRDEEIVVLSMYDGIATGRYCLDKMGFTNVKYHAYEIDKYPIQIALDNYPDIIEHGDAFAVREDDWKAPQTRSEWLDELLGGGL